MMKAKLMMTMPGNELTALKAAEQFAREYWSGNAETIVSSRSTGEWDKIEFTITNKRSMYRTEWCDSAREFRIYKMVPDVELIKARLVNAATTYDRKQSRTKQYNRYALAQYLARIDDVCADIENGAEPGAAISRGFCGPVLRVLAKAIGTTATDDNSRITYEPVNA